MTRLRYIVDRPRGPRGGNADERHLYSSLDSAQRACASVTAARYGGRQMRAAKPSGNVLTVDLDALMPVGATLDEHYEWHERQALFHAGEAARFKATASNFAAAQWLTSTDLDRIREAVSEWNIEEDRLRRGGGATPAARGAYFLFRDMWRAGKFGRR